MGEPISLDAQIESLRATASQIGKHVGTEFAKEMDVLLGAGPYGGLLPAAEAIKSYPPISEVGWFSDSLQTWLGQRKSGIIGYLAVVQAGLDSYRKALDLAAEAYETRESWSQDQLNKIDVASLSKMGITYTEDTFVRKDPHYRHQEVVNNGISDEVRKRTSFAPRGAPVESQWDSLPIEDIWTLLTALQPEPAGHVAGRIADLAVQLVTFSNALRKYKDSLIEEGNGSWRGIAAEQYSALVEQTASSMHTWATHLVELAAATRNNADALGNARAEAQRIGGDYQEAMSLLADYKRRYPDAIVASTEREWTLFYTDQMRTAAKNLTDALVRNTRWETPGDYAGMMMEGAARNLDAGPGTGPGGGPGAGPAAGPRAGPGAGPGGGPGPGPRRPNATSPPPRNELGPLFIPGLDPPGNDKKPDNADPNRPPGVGTPNPGPAAPNLPGPANPLGPGATPGLGDRPGSAPGLGGTPALPTTPIVPGLPPGGLPTLPGASPLLPGPSRVDTPSVSPPPGNGVALPGRTGGARPGGGIGGDPGAGLPTANVTPLEPATVTPVATSIGPGGGGGGGVGTNGVPPMMPPMMGGMPPGAGGSGQGGGPRSVRRGGPRLVDPGAGDGPAALSGRSRDRGRDKPKVVSVETESWTAEQERASAPHQPQARPAPGVG